MSITNYLFFNVKQYFFKVMSYEKQLIIQYFYFVPDVEFIFDADTNGILL